MGKKKSPRLQPLGVHVLVEPLPPTNDWVLAGKAKERSERGTVIAVGEAVESQALHEAIGSTVVFRQYAEEEYKIGDKRLYLIEESDIMGIWHE